eukprot:483641_1
MFMSHWLNNFFKQRNTYCNNVDESFLIVDAVSSVLLTIVIQIVAIKSLIKVLNYHKKKPFTNSICFSQLVFYIVTIIYGAIQMIYEIISCFLTGSTSRKIFGIILLIRILSKFFYNAVFFLRVIHVFEDTIYKLNKCSVISLTVFIMSFSTFGLFFVGYYLFYESNEKYLNLCGSISFTIDLTFSLIVEISFVYKLYQVNKQQKITADITNIQHNDSFIGTDDKLLLNTMTKYTILATIASVTTTMSMVPDLLQVSLKYSSIHSTKILLLVKFHQYMCTLQ